MPEEVEVIKTISLDFTNQGALKAADTNNNWWPEEITRSPHRTRCVFHSNPLPTGMALLNPSCNPSCSAEYDPGTSSFER
ncbi:hypothetical protein CEXT_24801 [Caerostris extrusa]|uniref:Uncharacterized protein n=1 Tax=Caerostris extrusa TaxID=172846 RepID=A0AAV4XUC6_CAEEX|nr:hypothetical protein CEXT_24801 [Caerostris extrusa]